MDLFLFNLLVATIGLLFFVAFLLIFLANREIKAAGWVALCFLCGILAQQVDQNRALLSPYFLDYLPVPLFWAAGIAGVIAFCARVNSRPSFPVISVAIGIGLIALLSSDDLAFQGIVMDWTAASICVAGVMGLWPHRHKMKDHYVCWFTVIFAVVLAIRPVVIIFDIVPTAFTTSRDFYYAAHYFTTIILAILGANIFFFALGFDLIEKHQREAMVDTLTGLYNRRGISKMMDEYESRRGDILLSGRAILLFDIDHFKKVNDQFGHDAGDDVLARIGVTIRQLMHQHGFASRSGGEEFMFFFNRESSEAAFLIAEHLRVAIGMLVHKSLPDDYRVTVSLGLAFIREGEPLKRAMRRADVALYAAKDAGRNCMRLADGDTPPENKDSKGLPSRQHFDPMSSEELALGKLSEL